MGDPDPAAVIPEYAELQAAYEALLVSLGDYLEVHTGLSSAPTQGSGTGTSSATTASPAQKGTEALAAVKAAISAFHDTCDRISLFVASRGQALALDGSARVGAIGSSDAASSEQAAAAKLLSELRSEGEAMVSELLAASEGRGAASK